MSAFFALFFTLGCETDSYMNPSVTGYYENTPTTMPVLDRIDVIEPPEEPLGVTGPPEPQDLIANTLQYRLASGDEVGVEIYELISVGRTEAALRVVDQGGYIRLPTINEVKAAGLTLEELRESIREKLEPFIKNPVVTVDIQKGRSFEFTIQGAIQNAGIFALNKPNFRLTNAIALAGGADVVAERVLVVRSMTTEQDVEKASTSDSSTNTSSATTQTSDGSDPTNPSNPTQNAPNSASGTTAAPVDIESLINKLSEGDPPAPTPTPTPVPVPTPTPAPTPAPA
ncbi:MAG: polysaccharide export protein, partial [Planctomycetota bacterium]|nr:polysaccharide export protein [Planctomycetota bacterium]